MHYTYPAECSLLDESLVSEDNSTGLHPIHAHMDVTQFKTYKWERTHKVNKTVTNLRERESDRMGGTEKGRNERQLEGDELTEGIRREEEIERIVSIWSDRGMIGQEEKRERKARDKEDKRTSKIFLSFTCNDFQVCSASLRDEIHSRCCQYTATELTAGNVQHAQIEQLHNSDELKAGVSRILKFPGLDNAGPQVVAA